MKIDTSCTKTIVIFKESYPTVGEFTLKKRFLTCLLTNSAAETHNIDLQYAKLSFCKVSINSGPDSKKSFLVRFILFNVRCTPTIN